MFNHPDLDDSPRQIIRIPLGTVVICLVIVLIWVFRPASPFWGA